MKETILGLLGGGVLVQALNVLATLRPTRRKADADALGAEVTALERTINLIYSKFEESERRAAEREQRLQSEIERLRARVRELEDIIAGRRP